MPPGPRSHADGIRFLGEHNNGNNNKNALLGADRHAAAALRQREHERADDQGRASGNLKPGARAEPRLRAARLRPQHARGMLHLHGCPSPEEDAKNVVCFPGFVRSQFQAPKNAIKIAIKIRARHACLPQSSLHV